MPIQAIAFYPLLDAESYRALTAQLYRLSPEPFPLHPVRQQDPPSTRFNRSTSSRNGISVGSSIFLGGFKVQWHNLSR
jgi:hypothetical protein